MATLVLLVAVVPTTVALSILSDVGSFQEETKKAKKMDAGNMSIPGDYHTYDQARGE